MIEKYRPGGIEIWSINLGFLSFKQFLFLFSLSVKLLHPWDPHRPPHVGPLGYIRVGESWLRAFSNSAVPMELHIGIGDSASSKLIPRFCMWFGIHNFHLLCCAHETMTHQLLLVFCASNATAKHQPKSKWIQKKRYNTRPSSVERIANKSQVKSLNSHRAHFTSFVKQVVTTGHELTPYRLRGRNSGLKVHSTVSTA